jgi:hypothetical protein
MSASKIKLELSSIGSSVTQERASEVITFNLANAARELASANPETIRFDLLSGKLIIAASHRWGPVSLGYGEVNVYKLASVTAAAVVACRSTQASSFQGCANKTIDGIGALVTT